jgi:hypothetical protein
VSLSASKFLIDSNASSIWVRQELAGVITAGQERTPVHARSALTNYRSSTTGRSQNRMASLVLMQGTRVFTGFTTHRPNAENVCNAGALLKSEDAPSSDDESVLWGTLATTLSATVYVSSDETISAHKRSEMAA